MLSCCLRGVLAVRYGVSSNASARLHSRNTLFERNWAYARGGIAAIDFSSSTHGAFEWNTTASISAESRAGFRGYVAESGGSAVRIGMTALHSVDDSPTTLVS